MKNVICIIIFLFSISYGHSQKNYIIPEPTNITIPNSKEIGFRLSKKTSIEVSGINNSRSFIKSFIKYVENETGFILNAKYNKKTNILFKVQSGINNLGNEGYKIIILPKENLTIEANSENGLFYGIQTLKQIIHYTKRKRNDDEFTDFDIAVKTEEYKNFNSKQSINAANITTTGYKSINETGYFQGLEKTETKKLNVYNFASVIIEDNPRFGYRGMMLDVSRHFMPLSFIKKFIDIIAMHKMNTFHWHLSDDQGWRIEIKKYPKLTSIGSKRTETVAGHVLKSPVSLRIWKDVQKYDGIPHEGYYTQEEIKEVVAYASERFITIIPEIDLPGHTSSLIAAYPEYGSSDKNIGVKTIWGIQEDIIKPNENTFNFLKDVFTEIADLFPSQYIHIGGDEANKKQWIESEEVQEIMKNLELENEAQLQSYFISRMEKILNSLNKKIIGWDEIIQGGLNPNATIMSWRGIEGGITAAKAGNYAIMTPTSHCYFDYYQRKSSDEPLAIGGFTPLQKVYEFEPIPKELDLNQSSKILGAQGNLWTEFIKTPEQVEYMTVPRMTALSEVVWSKRKVRNFKEFKLRLNLYKYFLDLENINYSPHEFK
ncbi:MAG: beta-N-acetylhexosaminidase [Marinoscillum sp.]|jgi:hexosaminidase|nr:beta-N-acetylglucosaminidase [Flavobacteriaceae bacterium]